jgi:hypothetical protein
MTKKTQGKVRIGYRLTNRLSGGEQNSLEPNDVNEFPLQDTDKTMSS